MKKITVQTFWVFLSLFPHSISTSVVLRPKWFVVLFKIISTKDKTTKFQFPQAQTHQCLCFPGAEFCVSYSRLAKVISPVLEKAFERGWTELFACVLLKFCCLGKTQLPSFSSEECGLGHLLF